MPKLRLVLLSCLLAESLAPEALAASSRAQQCVASDDKALSLEEAGKLVEARTELVACSATSCPKDIRGECEKELAAVVAAIPTVVFEPKDAAGRDIAGVDVAIDGTPRGKLDGTQLEVDPGQHEFVFTSASQPTVTASFILHQGEKGRHERVALGQPSPVAPSPPPPISAEGSAQLVPSVLPRRKMTPLTIAGYITGGVGVVGLGVGTAFGVLAFAAKNAQESACSTSTCGGYNRNQASTDLSNEQRDAAISTGAFIAGGVLVATGAVLLLTGGRGGDAHGAGLLLTPSPLPGGGAILLRGEF